MAFEHIFYAGPKKFVFDDQGEEIPGARRSKPAFVVDFMPTGPLQVVAGEVPECMLRKNPGDWRESKAQFGHIRDVPGDRFAARIIIGHNVGADPIWTTDDIKTVVFSIYEKINPADPGLTIVMGEGIFRGSGDLVSEKSSQISIINFTLTQDEFESAMFQLAHGSADALLQESVVLDLQNRGQNYYSRLIPSNLPKHKMDAGNMVAHIQRVKALTEKFQKRFKEA